MLERAFHDSETTLYPNCRARIERFSRPETAIPVLHGAHIPVLVCDATEQPGSWQLLARELRLLSRPPCLILSSGSERFLAEDAKYHVYEVLAKPLQVSEVRRIIRMAWLHWQNRYGLPAPDPATDPHPGYEQLGAVAIQKE